MQIESYSKRIVLLIGQSSGGAKLERLPKLEQEHSMVKLALQELGFQSQEIVELKNRTNQDMEEGLENDFYQMLCKMSEN